MRHGDVGIYGTGAMGLALARNLARKNYKVILANRTIKAAKEALEEIQKYKESRNITIVDTIEDMVKVVRGPIILLIPSGDPQEDLITGKSTTPIDDVIFNGSEAIYPDGKVRKIKPLAKLVNRNHIVIDAGNSHPYATALRDLKLSRMNVKFLGMGVSGGEMGALTGPSLMPGGSFKTYKKIENLLKSAAAKSGKTICCEWMGPAGAGHLVKIVHNGIEYAIMQAIAEAYWMLKQGLNLTNKQIKKFFDSCDKGVFKSYLLEITTHILDQKHKDEYVLDQILDSAGAKGTGKWTTQIAGDLGIAAGAIYSALEARQISNKKQTRQQIYKKLGKGQKRYKGSKFILQVKEALFSTILLSYIQGFEILKAASDERIYTSPHRNFLEGTNKELLNYKKSDLEKELDLVKIARVWKAGCIIRSNLLKVFEKVFDRSQDINLLLKPQINKYLKKYYKNWQAAVKTTLELDIPYQVTSSAFNYFNAVRSKELPANMTQAQRDLFGAHTYVNKRDSKVHHHFWGKKYSITKSYSLD